MSTLRAKDLRGEYLQPDGWEFPGCLIHEDNWDRAAYRVLLPSPVGPITSLACNVTLTSRQPVYRYRGARIPSSRCRIQFPGDGEPDVITHGWITLSTYDAYDYGR